MPRPRTVGQLRRAGVSKPRPGVREEMRANLLAKLKAGEKLFPAS